MKNIVKYMMAAVAGMGVLAACEQLEDFQTTVDAPDVLVYSQRAGSANVHTTKVAHAPVGSFGSYDAVFPVTCNSGSHKATTVKVVYDAEAAQAYKDEKKLAKQGMAMPFDEEKSSGTTVLAIIVILITIGGLVAFFLMR